MPDPHRSASRLGRSTARLLSAALVLAAAAAAAEDATDGPPPWGERDWPLGWEDRDLPEVFATETEMRLYGTGIDCDAPPCPYWVAIDEASGEQAVVTDIDASRMDDPVAVVHQLDELTVDGTTVVGSIVERPVYPGQIGSPMGRVLVVTSVGE